MGLRRLTVWDVFLELDDEGHCMGHVAALPGCFVRATDRDAVEQALPDAIRAFTDWLAEHGEAVSGWRDGDSIHIAGIDEGSGPFDPGDAAMLLPDEAASLTDDELERALRIAGYSRAELLRLVVDLDAATLAWKPGDDEMSVGEILRHIGNAEEWYVSRLVAPEALPPEWGDDDQMPLFEFLAMERRTVIAQLRALSAEARADVFYPTVWTRHPDEPWTARKALRRLLEHECEHIEHIREILTRADHP